MHIDSYTNTIRGHIVHSWSISSLWTKTHFRFSDKSLIKTQCAGGNRKLNHVKSFHLSYRCSNDPACYPLCQETSWNTCGEKANLKCFKSLFNNTFFHFTELIFFVAICNLQLSNEKMFPAETVKLPLSWEVASKKAIN